MQDPIGSFERIRELFISYLDTAFRIRDEDVAAERQKLLRQPGAFTTQPLLEPVPRYTPLRDDDGRAVTFDDLLLLRDPEKILEPLEEKARRAFIELTLAGLFPSVDRPGGDPTAFEAEFPPYEHQVTMLERGVRDGLPGIVTSGTGSGKTEAFLMPVLASIAKEAVDWPEPDVAYLTGRWWHDPATGRPYQRTVQHKNGHTSRKQALPSDKRPSAASPLQSAFTPHRKGEARTAAVRALILYPMNALVEDQLVRLRKALDSSRARDVMEERLGRNRVFFGRYIGATPVTGHMGSVDEPRGLDAFLLAKKKAAKAKGAVWFPDHKKSNAETDELLLEDAWQDEYERRQRRLDALFDHCVDLEKSQAEARLHSLDVSARTSLQKAIEKHEAQHGKASVDPTTFLDLSKTAGKRSRGSLLQQFVQQFPDVSPPDDLTGFLLQESDAEDAISARLSDDSAFMFPSIDGCEQSNRWDMQVHPPDILITNVSMLSAMLNREVEDPIIEKTRTWLEEEADARFYLVLDELHLQRGAAGTEVAYLLRLLLTRLGLTDPERRHKLRILASSASLPADAPESVDYLSQMFGSFGLGGTGPAEDPSAQWRNAIIGGREEPGRYEIESPPPLLDPSVFVALLRNHRPKVVADPSLPLAEPLFAIPPNGERSNAWRAACDALGIAEQDLPSAISLAIAEAAERLQWACLEQEEGGKLRTRAKPVEELADRLFEALPVGSDGYADRLEAVRGLFFVRGAADGLAGFLPEDAQHGTSFRLHTFFRSIEGLYAPAMRGAGCDSGFGDNRLAPVGRLTLDRKPKIEVGGEDLRVFELIYCECCGELFFGGMRARGTKRLSKTIHAELLPQEDNLAGLPDEAVSQRFEELSWQDYAVFWAAPWSLNPADLIDRDRSDIGQWRPGALDPVTGSVLTKTGQDRAPAPVAARLLEGWHYDKTKKNAGHGRTWTDAGTHVPYACPRCLTSYSGRRDKKYRLSPIRNFRAGFAKTTQLLATELFDAQRVSSPGNEPKLVSFSDSRQDAAKAALDIERNHHQDLRRELLVRTLGECDANRDSLRAELEKKAAELQAVIDGASATLKPMYEKELGLARAELRKLNDPAVPIETALGYASASATTDGATVPALVSMLARLGVHPYDGAGIDRTPGEMPGGKDKKYFQWSWLVDLETTGTEQIQWRLARRPEEQQALESARRNLVTRLHEVTTDVVFGKTYFSLEETGLGYATVPTRDGDEHGKRAMQLAALLRVLTDVYRYLPNPFARDDGKSGPTEWLEASQVDRRHVRVFAKKAWGEEDEQWKPALSSALQELSGFGHRDGIVRVAAVWVQLAGPDDRFYRCTKCERVHLHPGLGLCTRCFQKFEWKESELPRLSKLGKSSFLARRIKRGEQDERAGFRLHCEELTGQTQEPARRQREFRGIFIPRLEDLVGSADDSELGVRMSADELYRRRSEIDLLTVTTTMEVGIDIGPLQVVLQANMPPQRFNYQQRVGRAGRRKQAFSMVLTICRTRSHDAYYFEHPKKITGDVPPTPFLTKRMPDIGQRLLRKAWLRAAFNVIRDDIRAKGEAYAGDLLVPPDIHGEYVPRRLYHEQPEWRKRLTDALTGTKATAERVAEALAEGADLTFVVELNDIFVGLRRAVQEELAGLGNAAAECGLLPMYGMPTRVRNLYTGLERGAHGRQKWRCIDRDLDLAIFEFAPGSTVVMDKREYLAVGFTSDLSPPFPVKGGRAVKALQSNGAFDRPFFLVQCGVCHAWTKTDSEEGLDACECKASLSGKPVHPVRVPNGFRTNLMRARTKEEEVGGGVRHRSIQAEAKRLKFEKATEFGESDWILEYVPEEATTYRLNRGPKPEDDDSNAARGFVVQTGVDDSNSVTLPSQVISADAALRKRVPGFAPATPKERIWLGAPKATQALYLIASSLPERLALHALPSVALDGEGVDPHKPWEGIDPWIGVRAAAVSATFLIANRAALELDIDPEEFDVLEPRQYGENDQRPLLTITDHLVNGAGYCRWLADNAPGEAHPRIATMIRSILQDPEKYPQNKFFESRHLKECDTSCYRCLRRYGNQPFHGLLDWQLGLSFLRALIHPQYVAGLDGKFEQPELSGWPAIAEKQARVMAERFGPSADRGEGWQIFEGVPAFKVKLTAANSPWVLIRHPLWDWDTVAGPPKGLLAEARKAAKDDDDMAPFCWDSFNLARRQVFVREAVRLQVQSS